MVASSAVSTISATAFALPEIPVAYAGAIRADCSRLMSSDALTAKLTFCGTKPSFSQDCCIVEPYWPPCAKPIYAEISIDIDMNARRAHCKAGSSVSSRGEPILNPVTKEEHRVGILLPNGFEYGQTR
jgi:hypothetical protein